MKSFYFFYNCNLGAWSSFAMPTTSEAIDTKNALPEINEALTYVIAHNVDWKTRHIIRAFSDIGEYIFVDSKYCHCKYTTRAL